MTGERHFKTHCIHGHDLAIVGRNSRNGCRECDRLRRKKKHEADPSKNRARCWRNYLLRTFGITPEQRDEMVLAQGGKCAICELPPRGQQALHLDHDHGSGKLRGLLCYRCNRYLVGPHTLDTAKHLVAYLERYE